MKVIEACVKRNFWLLILALTVAAAFALPRITQAAFLRERVMTTTDAVDMLAAAVEANPDRQWYDHEFNIRDGVEHLDQVEQVYAAAFKVVDGEYRLFTARYAETSPFEPFDFPAFVEAVKTQYYGHIVINYSPEGQSARDLHVYFRWMPLYSGSGEQYLVVVGVSKYSIVSNAYMWVSIGLWILVIAVAIPTVRCILQVAECGIAPKEKKSRDRGRLRLSALKKSG